MNLLAPLASLFRPAAERERESTLKALEKQLVVAQKKLKESYDYAHDLVADWERERDAILGGGNLAGRRGARRQGDSWPFLRNMEDLNRYRAESREACEGNGYGAGMLDRAIDFVIGDGMQPEITLKGAQKGAVATGVADADGDGRPDADPAVEAVKDIIDRFREANDWGCGEEDREEEGFRRSQRDGEVFVRFFKGEDGIPFVRWIEPEQVDSPPSSLPNERWGLRYKTGDVESLTHVYVYDTDRSDGDWVPASEVVRHKLGTDRTVLRGMPQFWLVAQALYQSDKLNSAVAEVSAIQAQIAYVRQHPPGVLPGQITDFVGGTGDGLGAKRTPYGDKYRRVGYSEAGTVVDMSNGMQFEAGPVSQGVPGFVQALQSRLRQVCARFGYPEYFTGDGSNANYASTLVAGGPAERAFKRRQQKYAAFQAAVYRKACEYAVEANILSQADLDAVEIKVKPGKVTISNNLEEANVDQILIQNKIKSVQTVQAERGLDPRVEAANIEAWDAKFGGGAMGLDPNDPDGGGDQGGPLLDPAAESYTEAEYQLLTEAQRNLLVKKVVTDKNGKKVTRWVRAGGTMGGPEKGVQKAQLTKLGPGAKGGDAGKGEPAKLKGGASKPAAKTDLDKPAPKGDPKDATATGGKPKAAADLTYLPKNHKKLTVDQAERALKDLGIGEVVRSLDGGVRLVRTPDGEEVEMTPTQIKVAIYGTKSLPKASRLDMTDVSRLYGQTGEGRVVRASKVAKTAAGGLAVTHWVVADPDGKGEFEVADKELRKAIVKAGLARESYTESEYLLLSEADRSHLVRKVITNRKGHKQTVYVRAGKDKPKPKKDKAVVKGVALERAGELIRKGVKTKAQARELAGHLKTLTVADIEGLKKEHAARVGGKLKQDQVDRLVAYAQGRGSVADVKGSKVTTTVNPPVVSPAPPPTLTTPAQSLLSRPDAEVAAKVLDAADAEPGEFGGNNVFIHKVYDRLKAEDPSLTEADFKRKLIELNRSRHLDLVTADLIQAFRAEDIARSELDRGTGGSDRRHFIAKRKG